VKLADLRKLAELLHRRHADMRACGHYIKVRGKIPVCAFQPGPIGEADAEAFVAFANAGPKLLNVIDAAKDVAADGGYADGTKLQPPLERLDATLRALAGEETPHA
jgi:hypothetical protein